MLEKYFVPYEQALELKELGFNEECLKLWEKTILFTMLVNPEEFKKVVSERYVKAPLYQQAFEWFRENHGIYGQITYQYSDKYYVFVEDYLYEWEGNNPKGFIYEEAQLACLKMLIEIIKEKK